MKLYQVRREHLVFSYPKDRYFDLHAGQILLQFDESKIMYGYKTFYFLFEGHILVSSINSEKDSYYNFNYYFKEVK